MQRIRSLANVIIGCVLLGAAGCASEDGDFPNRTAVLIYNHTEEEIRDMTITVFQEAMYEMTVETKQDLVFEKQGSKWQTFTYGGWSGPVWERVKVSIRDYGAGAIRVEARISLLENRGDRILEEEDKVYRRKSKEHQALLDSIAERLNLP